MTATRRFVSRAAALLVISAVMTRREALAQDDEIILTTPASRATVLEAMNAAAVDLHTIGTSDSSGTHWRSGLITHPADTRSRGIPLAITTVITAELNNPVPDTTRVRFRAQRNAFSATDLVLLVQRTQRHLAGH